MNLLGIDWIRIATEIELNYSFDAFVILHGTDTMCYTSSALSFLLEDLGKTVVYIMHQLRKSNLIQFIQIFTGAQIPLSQLRNDAVDNLMGALTIAGHFIIPGKSFARPIHIKRLISLARVLLILQPYSLPRKSCVKDVFFRSWRVQQP